MIAKKLALEEMIAIKAELNITITMKSALDKR